MRKTKSHLHQCTVCQAHYYHFDKACTAGYEHPCKRDR